MMRKTGWGLGLLIAVAVIGTVAWFSLFNKDIYLPDVDSITRIEVRQNDFEQKAQQVSYVEEKAKIGKIYDFIHQRRTGWEKLMVTPPGVQVLVHFYKGDKVLFHLYLLKNDRLLIGNKDGAFSHNIHKIERTEIERLLGIGEPAPKDR
ncbi:MAG TPA: hypothetical protein VHE12_00880 [bacterium]|nr:hypothetical protein [bacterium]